jgi:AcrR family transcriptional regulator
VIATALAIIEEDGPDALTMRRIAGDLGVTPMAIYTHVENKATLLEALIDAVLGELDLDRLDDSGWRPWMTSFANTSRTLFLKHPKFVRVLAEYPSVGPNALRIGERAYGVLLADGLPPDAAVQGFWTVFTYVVGFVALESPRAEGAADDDAEAHRQRIHAYAGLDRRVYPLTVQLAPHIAAMVSSAQFRAGLENILNGIAAQRR